MHLQHPFRRDVRDARLLCRSDHGLLPTRRNSAEAGPLVDGNGSCPDGFCEGRPGWPLVDQIGDSLEMIHDERTIMEETSIAQDGKFFDWLAGHDGKNVRMPQTSSKDSPSEPSRVAQRLEALFAAADVNRAEVADLIKLDRSSMTKVMKGEKPLKPEWAVKICELYGVSLDFLYRGQLRDLPPTLSKKIIAALTR